MPAAFAAPESLSLRLSGSLLPQDFVVADLLRNASALRPICVACTVARYQLPWLRPYLRPAGLLERVVPSADPAARDLKQLRLQLIERVSYAGVADRSITMDPTSQAMSRNYFSALESLAKAQLEEGDAPGCLETLRFAEVKCPPARLGLEPNALASMRQQADSTLGAAAAKPPGRNAGTR